VDIMAEENRGKDLLLLAAGAAAGALLGILFAPQSGKETREDIKDWLKERREKGKELVAKIKEPVAVKKDQLAAAARAAKEAYQEAGTKHNGHTRDASVN
jgi:gas vesicle protein